MNCFAYDLRRDPGKVYKIRPILLGTDGISKKIAVPFFEPMTAMEPFSIVLHCDLLGCMKEGLEYYTSTLSFGQYQVRGAQFAGFSSTMPPFGFAPTSVPLPAA